MAITRYLLPALAAVSTIAAQCSIPSSSTTSISNPAGASQLAACTTFSGNVALATGVAEANTVSLDGIQVITGSLSYQGDNNVQTFHASQLSSTGDLQLGNLTSLSTLSFGSLSQVGNLNFTGLPTVSVLDFGSGLKKALSVLITNTGLTKLTGISTLTQIGTTSSPGGFDISSNQYLQNIELDITSINGAINIGANDVSNGGLSVSFPNLQTATQMTFQNATSVLLPSLANISQNLGFYGNDFTSLACPNLTFAGGIVFVDNVDLTNISMPLLTTINGTNGTYQIANNTQLKSIDGFENLSNVKGNLDFSGNFSTVMLPKLTNVGGAMNVQTSSNFDCTTINGLGSTNGGNQVVKGAVTCGGSQSTPGSAGTTPTGTSSGSSASPTKTGAADSLNVNVPILMGGSSLVLGLLQLLL